MKNILFISLLAVILILLITFLKYRKRKPRSAFEELQSTDGYKDLKNLFDMQKKLMGEQGTDLDVMPEGFGEFGLEITNPIPTSTVFGSNAYLGSLLTTDGIKVGYERIGSMSVENIPNIIDGYRIFKNNEEICTLYLCPYNKKNSTKAPEGFELEKSDFS
ncbi:MAG: hypothetical protein WAT71_00515 [Ignavibacteria bacterium]